MPNIYIVEGRCGEYSDRQQWMVKAYGTEEAARACVGRYGIPIWHPFRSASSLGIQMIPT